MSKRTKAAAEYVFDSIATDVKRLGQAVGDRTVLGAALDHLALDRRGPNGHTYDTQPGPRAETWCWTHQRPVHACHQADLICDGESITIDDPTDMACFLARLVAQALAVHCAHHGTDPQAMWAKSCMTIALDDVNPEQENR